MKNTSLQELGLKSKEVQGIVELTGATDQRDFGFTFSELLQRLIPSIVLDVYPDKAVEAHRAIEIAKSIIPTTPFKES